jgi:hypothetical protein
MSGKLAGLRKRLVRVEKALAEPAGRDNLAFCTCKGRAECSGTIAFSNKPEEFEAEMNQKCPVHGFRHLGRLIVFRVVAPGRKDERCRLDELLEEYRARDTQPVWSQA